MYYLDSSAVMRWIFRSPGYFKSFKGWSESVSSILLSIECYRTLDRLRLEGKLDDEEVTQARLQVQNIADSLQIVSIDDAVAALAQTSFPTVVKSLDAIHLATALLWQDQTNERLTIVSHDKQFCNACAAMRMSVYAS